MALSEWPPWMASYEWPLPEYPLEWPVWVTPNETQMFCTVYGKLVAVVFIIFALPDLKYILTKRFICLFYFPSIEWQRYSFQLQKAVGEINNINQMKADSILITFPQTHQSTPKNSKMPTNGNWPAAICISLFLTLFLIQRYNLSFCRYW